MAVFGLAVLAATEAKAVILSAGDGRNEAAPSDSSQLAAWNLQATWGGVLATPIAPQYALVAKHVGLSSTVTLGSATYDVVANFDDPNSDLRLIKINGTFTNYAKLYTESNETGKEILIFGRGTQRGDAVTVDGKLKGWKWGTSDGVKSWGTNTVDGIANYKTSDSFLLRFDFKDNSAAGAGLSERDSSGGVFIKVDNEWQLAGINYAVTTPWSMNSDGSDSFNANIFDASGLYYKVGNNWAPVTGSGFSVATRVSSRIDWINSIIAAPEPSTMALLISAVPLAGIAAWKARRRKRRHPTTVKSAA
jgi:hypothetical protein